MFTLWIDDPRGMDTTHTTHSNEPSGESSGQEFATIPGEERRSDTRFQVERACRIASGGRWVCARGQTLNASRQGLLLCVETERIWNVGDPVAVAVDWAGHAVLGASSVVEGKVVRVDQRAKLVQRLGIMLNPDHATPIQQHVQLLAAHAQAPVGVDPGLEISQIPAKAA